MPIPRPLYLLALTILAVSPLAADIVQPVTVQLTEQEPSVFLVRWQAPTTFPVRAIPAPVLPESCRASGERVLQEQPGMWLNRQVFRCPDGVAGQPLGVRYPFVVAGQTTVLRVEFLSGERLVHLLGPGEESWLVPEVGTGLLEAPWANLRRAVVDGARHFLGGTGARGVGSGSWVHWGFWLVLVLLGGAGTSVRLITAFTMAQFGGLALAPAFEGVLPAPMAEAGIALTTLLLARELLRPGDERRQLEVLVAAAGLVHGLGLGALSPVPSSFGTAGWLYQASFVVGMDGVLLALALTAAGLWHLLRREPGEQPSSGLSYLLGAASSAGALLLVLAPPAIEAPASLDAARLPALTGEPAGSGALASRSLARRATRAGVQSFVSIEAFEVRHEILIRLRDVAGLVALDGVGTLEIAAQPGIKAAIRDLVVPQTEMIIDGEPAQPIVDRIDFLVVDSQGVMPRTDPLPERVSEAFVGVTVAYLTRETPREARLTWRAFPEGLDEIPATVSDPEFSGTSILTVEEPIVSWINRLSEDPTPRVAAISVQPRTLPVPWIAVLLMVASLWVGHLVAASRSRSIGLAVVRVGLVVALVVAPVAEIAVALPASLGSTPSTAQARHILAGVLPNIYRAFEFREESDAYDRLAVSVTGDTLSEIYLEHRRALQMEERGGARARVEAVEVPEVRSVEPVEGGGFIAEGVWLVGGTVTHFGHRHFRQNRYDARVTLVPVEGVWKIRTIELFDEERLR